MPFTSTSSVSGITRHGTPSIMRVSTRLACSGLTFTVICGVFTSNLRVSEILFAMTVICAPISSSYCFSNCSRFSSGAPLRSKSLRTCILSSSNGSPLSFCSSIISLRFSWMLRTTSYTHSSPRVSSMIVWKDSFCCGAGIGCTQPSSCSVMSGQSSFAFLE